MKYFIINNIITKRIHNILIGSLNFFSISNDLIISLYKTSLTGKPFYSSSKSKILVDNLYSTHPKFYNCVLEKNGSLNGFFNELNAKSQTMLNLAKNTDTTQFKLNFNSNNLDRHVDFSSEIITPNLEVILTDNYQLKKVLTNNVPNTLERLHINANKFITEKVDPLKLITDTSSMDIQSKCELNSLIFNDSYLYSLIKEGSLIIMQNDIILSEDFFIILDAIELSLI